MIKLIKFSTKSLYKKKLSFLLLTIFLTIWFSLLLFISIWKVYFTWLIEEYFLSNWVKNKIIVEQKEWWINNLINIWWSKSEWFSEYDIDNMLKISWVKNVFKYSIFKKTSVIKISLLWNYLESDAFFVWIDPEMLRDISPWFIESDTNIPMVVSNTAYNSIMELFFKKWLTSWIWKDLLFNSDFEINFGKSLLFPSWKKNSEKIWKLVGFSDDVWLVFIWVPFNTLNKINLELTWKDLKIDKLYVDIEDWYDQEKVQSQINKLWFITSFSDDKANSIKSLINLVYIVISFLIYFFIVIILYSLVSFMLLSLEERKKDNSIMFCLWIDKKLIWLIYFLEWFIISFTWLLLSLLFIKYFIYKLNLFISTYNSTHFIINLPEIIIKYSDLINLLVCFILLNLFFTFISFYKVYRTRYEEML